MMLQLVVFDMAGTTVDEQNAVYKTVHRALLRAGYEVGLETVLLHAAGKEKFKAIRDVIAFLEGGPANNETILDIFHDFETLLDAAYDTLQPLPMPGATAVLAQLKAKGVRVALNTGYKRAVAETLLQKLGWEAGREFDLLVTATEVSNGRPAPDMILYAMRALGVTDATLVAKIGDSIVDIEEGKNAGCGIVAGVTTGAQTRDQLATAQPTHIFDHLEALLPVVFPTH